MTTDKILSTALILGTFGLGGTGLVATIEAFTEERRELNKIEARLRNLNEVLSPDLYDNDILNDVIKINDDSFSPKYPTTVYRARSSGDPVAAVFETTAPEGYAGPIRMLVGIDQSGVMTGLRILEHRETPGLGDGIEADRSDWVFSFAGKSVGNPPLSGWAVKKDGGEFDQFTGATITPRLIVNTARKTLLYFNAHKDTVFTDGQP